MNLSNFVVAFAVPWLLVAFVNTIQEWQEPCRGGIGSIRASDSISYGAAAVSFLGVFLLRFNES